MIYVLFDNPSEIAYFTGAIKQPYEVMNIGSERGPHKKKVISCCWRCSRKVKDGDVIVCWLDFMAILCWWFCRNKKVKIIAVNILLKDSKGIAGYLKRLLYRAPLRDDSLVATVTSKGYGEFLNEYLGIQKEYVLLNDAYSRYKDKPVENVTVEKSVFCGGRNGRDWNKAFEIAQAMPDTAFNYVMSKKDYDKISKSQKSLPGNVKVSVDVSGKEFSRIMSGCMLVVMPLDTQAPAGLLVFYEAASKGKLIVTSDTVTTREYFTDGRGILCGNDVQEWADKISYYLNNPDEAGTISENCLSYLKEECSVNKYQEILSGIVTHAINS